MKPFQRASVQYLILAVLLVLIGVWFRAEDYPAWQSKSEATFLKDAPLLNSMDGYAYLASAQQLMDGAVLPLNRLRHYPEGLEQANPQSLLPYIAVSFSELFRCSLEWVAFWLPVFIALVSFIPLYFCGRWLCGQTAGWIAVGWMAVMPGHVLRTNIGRFDTDGLIVLWLLALLALCAWFLSRPFTPRKLAIWLMGVVLCGGLLWWTWDQARDVALLLTVVIIGLTGWAALIQFKASSHLWVLASLVTLLLLVAVGVLYSSDIQGRLLGRLAYLAADVEASGYPNIGVNY